MKASKRTFDTTVLYKRLYSALCRDLSNDIVLRRMSLQKQLDPRAKFDLHLNSVPYHFKRQVQIRDFYKRVILPSDKSFESLKSESEAAFILSQDTFGISDHAFCDKFSPLVKEIVADVLGPFDMDEFSTHCAYGKKAALGLSRRRSYLDDRIENATYLDGQLAWYNFVRAQDIHLQRATRHHMRGKTKPRLCPSIKVTSVPKTFKSTRIVAPDTAIGGFLSRGLGSYIRARLEGFTHIDLSVQQFRHRKWAKEASIRGHLATLDMSKASDSFVWEHIEKFVPETWHSIIKVLAPRFVEVSGVTHPCKSVMLMGSGHTFPLQTLLFWAICEACRRLARAPGKVSCYGDDLIVPTSCAAPSMIALAKCGFTINSDKSFFHPLDRMAPSIPLFRESCGGDFYGGVAVRPFMPECQTGKVSAKSYIAEIHKLYNGLCEVWHPLEVESALTFLLHELTSCNSFVAVVPDDETETAGLRVKNILYTTPTMVFPKIDRQTWCVTYRKLKSRMAHRAPRFERIYYWYNLWLSQRSNTTDSLYDEALNLLDEKGLEPVRGQAVDYYWNLG